MTVYRSASPAQTLALGEAVGSLTAAGDVIALIGELGTGKTLFVTGLARGLGIEPATYVSSPTFTIIHRYAGRLPLYHIDLYRIETPGSFASIGLDEYLEGDGVVVIEWADHGWGCLPTEMLTFRFRYAGSETRTIEIVPSGNRYNRLVRALMDDFLTASSCIDAEC